VSSFFRGFFSKSQQETQYIDIISFLNCVFSPHLNFLKKENTEKTPSVMQMVQNTLAQLRRVG